MISKSNLHIINSLKILNSILPENENNFNITYYPLDEFNKYTVSFGSNHARHESLEKALVEAYRLAKERAKKLSLINFEKTLKEAEEEFEKCNFLSMM